jgi:hypothetical protein
MSEQGERSFTGPAALAGVIAATVFLAVSQIVSLVTGATSMPVVALGSVVIDLVPAPVKDTVIGLFGTMDKIVLAIVILVVVALLSSLAGLLQWRRAPLGLVLIGLASIASIAAAVTRTEATATAWLPATLGGIIGGAALVILLRRLERLARNQQPAERPSPEQHASDRRRFLTAASVTGVVSVAVAIGARVVGSVQNSISTVREAIRLPAPSSTVEIPAGAELDVPAISPLVTPNADFYRIDTALVPPSLDVELTFDELLAMGIDEYAVTLTCVSNTVGGDLVGNAIWLGIPVRDILARAKPQDGADMVLSRSVDGFTASTPMQSLTDDGIDAILAVGMNGEPLPVEHGFPVRMVVPGLYGYVSATKWLTELKVTTFAADQAYWTPRGWSERGPVKLSSRIDTPGDGDTIEHGNAIAGVAWAQGTGIAEVEVRVDDGDWQAAELSQPIGPNTWLQWTLLCEASAGEHTIAVRATDADGTVQTADEAPPAPDGSTGLHTIRVTVE